MKRNIIVTLLIIFLVVLQFSNVADFVSGTKSDLFADFQLPTFKTTSVIARQKAIYKLFKRLEAGGKVVNSQGEPFKVTHKYW